MNLSKIFTIIAFVFITPVLVLVAQTKEKLEFIVVKEIPYTSVKNQGRTQTCWSFSGLSFFESEMIRMGKPEVDLSEMFVVNHCYRDKAQKFVRMKGSTNFGPGGIFYDLLHVTKNYGLVPEQAYNALINSTKHEHTLMDTVLRRIVDRVTRDKTAAISLSWSDSLENELSAHLGKLPEKFTYQGKTYTPKSFASDYCGINPDHYIQITSFSHHPYYKPFILEVPDNWTWSSFYNVPLDEMEQIMDYSLQLGFTIAWAADVTEGGFDTSNGGVALVPQESITESGTEVSNQVQEKSNPVKEKVITQEIRQTAFDKQETSDDHGMHITGLAKDQYGNTYYIVKNSWGDYNKYNGMFYASKPYIRYKTTSIMVHKNAIPKNIFRKLGL